MCGAVIPQGNLSCEACGDSSKTAETPDISSEQILTPPIPSEEVPKVRRGIPFGIKLCVILSLFIVAVLGSVYAFNYSKLQSKLNGVIKDDPRNQDIEVRTHYLNYVDTSTLVYDLRSISDTKSMADIFRVFLQFSDKMKTETFSEVILCYRGKKNSS